MVPSLHQIIHVAGRTPRLMKEHLQELKGAFHTLCRGDLECGEAELREAILQALDRGRYPLDCSSYVSLYAEFTGRWWVEVEQEFLYRGYVLRALRPEAMVLRFDVPFEGVGSVAADEAWHMAHEIAFARGVRSVVRANSEGWLCEGDGAPLFAAVGRRLYTSQKPRGVEGRLAVEAIRRAGYPLAIEPFTLKDLPSIDELFYLDHRGVTALSACEKKVMMASMAERVARSCEALFG